LDENNKYFEEEILFKNIFPVSNIEKNDQNPPNPPPTVSFFALFYNVGLTFLSFLFLFSFLLIIIIIIIKRKKKKKKKRRKNVKLPGEGWEGFGRKTEIF
jgi:amino acid transporter